jgi:hypothetical protein
MYISCFSMYFHTVASISTKFGVIWRASFAGFRCFKIVTENFGKPKNQYFAYCSRIVPFRLLMFLRSIEILKPKKTRLFMHIVTVF